MDQPSPKFLYRYSSFKREQGFERLIDILENNRLYFANPASFNDPFDMRPGITVDVHSEGFRQDYFDFMHGILKREGHYSLRKREEAIREKYNEIINGRTFQEMYRAYLETTGVCCLSANPESLLMWAHYCDGHDGYCIKFDTQLWNSKDGEITRAEEVVYQENYPEIDVWKLLKARVAYGGVEESIHAEAGRTAALRKSPEWRYEREWRILAKKPSYATFAPNSLIEVILGCNVLNETQIRLVEKVVSLKKQLTISKMKLHNKSYKLLQEIIFKA